MRIRHGIALLLLATLGIGADNCGVGNPLDKSAWMSPTPGKPMTLFGITCGMSDVWLCNLDPSVATMTQALGHLPCGVELCAADAAGAVAAATALLGNSIEVPQCIDVGFHSANFTKLQEAFASWDGTCLKPAEAPCKEVGATCEVGAGECCEPLLCDAVGSGPMSPYHCCVDIDAACKQPSDCCTGLCAGGTCVCTPIGDICTSDVQCCGDDAADPFGGSPVFCIGGLCTLDSSP